MNPFKDRYSHYKGTHCWFCNRQYGKSYSVYGNTSTGRNPIRRTREHIVPASKMKKNDPRNYIGSCNDCNTLKANMNAKEFALHVQKLRVKKNIETHNMYKYFKMIIYRSWKLYNKTSKFHKKYTSV